MRRNIGIFLGLLVMVLALAACGAGDNPTATPSPPAQTTPAPADTHTPSPESPAQDTRERPGVDREGFAITLPGEINTIISIGPSNTEVLVALGFGDKIISADRHSDNVEGIAEGVAVLDLLSLDAEFVLELNPDIVLVTGMTRVFGDDHPLRLVTEAGIAVIYMPTSMSIAEIMEDIRFIAAVMDAHGAGEDIIADMQTEIDAIREIAATISETRTVYFEISPAPTMWTLGANTFIHEMIELVGAVNIFADEDGWLGVADEVLLEASPDVIITSVNHIDDPVAEIMSRPGWDAITAVRNGDVFQVDTNYTNRQSHNIIIGLREIAVAIYPNYFQ